MRMTKGKRESPISPCAQINDGYPVYQALVYSTVISASFAAP
jgi:hypothetical protein